MQIAPTLVHATVESVTVGATGLSVQLRGLGDVPFGVVKEIGDQVPRTAPVTPVGDEVAPPAVDEPIPDGLET